ncbi:hypothetical protein Lesp02_03740 [Lentzea sp. NBRC 105346]|uniref:hypothetical protein n=1 Tax=Lentzea sp. NBRC 105346 TaxID=3032205 RepID=UPI0024A5CAF3|nr:hypothetical protein [Lentzea sp. NBRC 105346]GLZ28184.1 hypothetical protein Lesp02_03740 [Lentzea sp. NBRC 105346]
MTTHRAEPAPTNPEKTLPLPKLSAARLLALALYLPARGWWHRTDTGTKILIIVLIAAITVISLRTAEAVPPAPAAPNPTTSATATSPAAPTVTATPAVEDPAAIPPRRPDAAQRRLLPVALVGATIPDAPRDPSPYADPGPTVLHPTTEVIAYTEPGGTPIARLPERQIIAPTRLPVIARQPGWAMVLLPGTPGPDAISPAGWIHLEPAVELTDIGRRIEIDHSTGSIAVLAELGRATTTSTLTTPVPGSAPRTFVAIGAATANLPWPLTLMWPFTITGDKLCATLFGGISVPGLPARSPLGTPDATGCLTAPASLHDALTAVPAGATVISR